MEDIIADFPTDIQHYLREIAERLWSQHAAVMVGSGFSKNAVKSDHTKDDFPNWAALGDILYKKLYGRLPNETNSYLNILRLADEVQAAFGRSVLEKLVVDSIPDLYHTPSNLHIKLLDLPWVDIFTTNYDTLLERASQSVYNYKYDVVANKSELVFAEKPRIIKLHGSMPSERPFILTEEDYRRYPFDFAAFVNTVQQSLLENTFCLIGFSADDPNFLQWVGWINDNLGVMHAPKIYLINIHPISDAQKKLLQSKNILVVTLIGDNSSLTVEEALMRFIEFLHLYKSAERPLDWPEEQTLLHYSSEEIKANYENILSHWRRTRLNYPNWIVPPLRRASTLWNNAGSFTLMTANITDLDNQKALEFLFEFNWRMERCLCPIWDENIPIYETVVRRYDQEAIENLKRRKPDVSVEFWINLTLALWRYYREENQADKWSETNEKLDVLLPYLEGEYIARIYYEKCLSSIFSLDYDNVRQMLAAWPRNRNLPFWEAKRATLLAEVGQNNEAVSILESALFTIRERVLRTGEGKDFTWVSQESHVILLLRYVLMSMPSESSTTSLRHDNKELTDRQNILKLYDCDAWYDLETFELLLDRPSSDLPEQERVPQFQIGEYKTIRRFGGSSKELMASYRLFRYLEEAGIPPRLRHTTYAAKALTGAFLRLGKYSSHWTFSLIMRSGQEKDAEQLLTRSFISSLPRKECDKLIGHFVSLCEKLIASSESNYQGSWQAIPTILSRLIIKSSNECKSQVVSLLLKIYHSALRWDDKSILTLWELLFASLSLKKKYALIETLLEFPISDKNSDDPSVLPDPFYMLQLATVPDCLVRFRPNSKTIKRLLSLAAGVDGARINAVLRLATLHKIGGLTPADSRTFGKALWSIIDIDGLPAVKCQFRKFAFINMPHPPAESPMATFKKYLLNYSPPIESESSQQGVSFTNGDLPEMSDLLLGSKTKHSSSGVEWSEEEAHLLLQKLVHWWDCDKHYLSRIDKQRSYFNVSKEFRLRFRHLRDVLSDVLSVNKFWKEDALNQSTIKRVISEMESYKLPTLELKAAYLPLFPSLSSNIALEIDRSLCSNDINIATDAYNVVIDLTMDPSKLGEDPIRFRELLDLVVQQIKWRNYPILLGALNTLTHVVKNCADMLTERHIRDVLFGLNYLLLETSVNEKLPIDELLQHRKAGARLAFKLFKYNTGLNRPIPEAISNWEKAMKDDEEFDDIRNEWVV